jgi:hypothetical protein
VSLQNLRRRRSLRHGTAHNDRSGAASLRNGAELPIQDVVLFSDEKLPSLPTSAPARVRIPSCWRSRVLRRVAFGYRWLLTSLGMKGSDASRSSSANHAATSVTTGSTSTPRPTRRTLTRSPSNLNSRGSRTAWLRPILNSLAVVLTTPRLIDTMHIHRRRPVAIRAGHCKERRRNGMV